MRLALLLIADQNSLCGTLILLGHQLRCILLVVLPIRLGQTRSSGDLESCLGPWSTS